MRHEVAHQRGVHHTTGERGEHGGDVVVREAMAAVTFPERVFAHADADDDMFYPRDWSLSRREGRRASRFGVSPIVRFRRDAFFSTRAAGKRNSRRAFAKTRHAPMVWTR